MHRELLNDPNSRIRAQSAMEYLMTYGWAILIIAVVLASLFSLGVFNSGASAASGACSTRVGYLCSNPVLLSNGLLSTTIGSSHPITVTGVACSSGSSAPSSFSSANIALAAGAQQNVDFPCSLSSSAIGTPFSGNLWLQYNQSGQSGLVVQIASINAKVTAFGFGSSGGGGGSTTTGSSTTTISGGSPTCYALSLSYGTGGSYVDASPTNSVGCSSNNYVSGETITLNAVASSDYYAFSSWTGTTSNSMNPWTFAMPARAVNEHATFTPFHGVLVLSSNPGTFPLAITIDSSGNVYWINDLNSSIMELPSGTTGAASQNTIYTGMSDYNIAYDNGNLYWTDGIAIGLDGIMEMPVGGTTATTLYTESGASAGIAGLVVRNGNAYWTELDTGNVMEMPNGMVGNDHAITLASVGAYDPTGITVDSSGDVYWTGQRSGNVIEMPNGMFGNDNAITIYSTGGMSSIFGITVDNNGNRFWTDDYNQVVTEMPHGMIGVDNAITVYSGSNQPDKIISDSNGNIYWLDYGAGTVMEMPHGMIGNENSITIASGQDFPIGITIHNNRIYWADEDSGNIMTYVP